MTSVAAYLIGVPIVLSDIKANDKTTYGELGRNFFFNPFKQADFIIYIVSRRYAKDKMKFHKYDFLLIVLVVLVLSLIGWNGAMLNVLK
jgi:hypothetical protein